MIRDLLTPTAHRDPYTWAAVLLAHAAICQGLVLILAGILGPICAAYVISAGYLLLWEGRQLHIALRRGDQPIAALADGLIDTAGVTLGCQLIAYTAAGRDSAAITCWMALLLIAAIGYLLREKGRK
ncbi:MAG: hypothetical protein Q4G25_12730 [Paracoccus sp. (in: a-proteobacteria)]|nr:hypothetical protein [Paracoccus sp. (in: a-proteobacteria)]